MTGFLGEREMILGEKGIIQRVIEFLGEKEDLGRKRVLREEKSKK